MRIILHKYNKGKIAIVSMFSGGAMAGNITSATRENGDIGIYSNKR
jgi:hypothetical protein